MKQWIRNLLLRALGIPDAQERLLDLERHFITKRNAEGAVTETLADVPMAKRKELRSSTAGLSWQQRRAVLEATDGGMRAAVNGRLPGNS